MEDSSLKAFLRQSFRVFDFLNLSSDSRYFESVTLNAALVGKESAVVAISEGAYEVYFVLSWSEGIPFREETCESFLSADGCHESVVLNTCDKNVQKRNCSVLV